ncbi:MAG: HD domain-containing protein [Phycisphaerales bacterium]
MTNSKERGVSLWQKAATLGARFHRNQIRKDGETPYFSHPVRVALTIREVFEIDDPAILAAALLHDVIEDTTADYDDVLDACGEEVADIVAAMTKDMRVREDRREPQYDEMLSKASWKARAVKLADVFDNFSDAHSEKARLKTADKARRAIALAERDPELTRAVEIVRALISGA